jgi:hypothetical protein
MEELKPMAQRAHKHLYGFYFDEITASEVKSNHGSYRGGYVPAIADRWFVSKAENQQGLDEIGAKQFTTMFPQTGKGFTKGRVENYNVHLVSDLTLVTQHIDKVLRFSHIQPAATDAARLINSMAPVNVDGQEISLFDAFSKYDPGFVKEALIPFLSRAASQLTEIPAESYGGRQIDRALRFSRTSASAQLMAVNILNALQNLPNIIVSAGEVGITFVTEASWKYARSPQKVREFVEGKSKFMYTNLAKEADDIKRDVHDLIVRPGKYAKTVDWLSINARFASKYTQDLVNVITWVAAYEQALSKKATEADAVFEADSAVRRTQGSMEAEDLSRVEVQTPFVKMFSMFYSFFNNAVNYQGANALKILRELGLSKGRGQLAYLYLYAFYAPFTIAALMGQAARGKWDDDDDGEYIDDILTTLLFGHLRTATAYVPFAGSVMNAALGTFTTKAPYDDRISMSPAIQMADSTIRSVGKLTGAVPEGRPGALTKDVLTSIGWLSGAPLGPVGKSLGYVMDAENGYITPESTLDYSRGVITGKSGK